MRKISQQEGDSIRITHLNSTQYTDYDLVDASRLSEHTSGNYVAQVGRTLRFNNTFKTTSTQYGGALTVPAYIDPEHISGDSDDVPVDDPNWLALITAAEYVRSDVTRQNQYPNLIAEANEAMRRMKQDNEGQDTTVYRPWNPLGHMNSGSWNS